MAVLLECQPLRNVLSYLLHFIRACYGNLVSPVDTFHLTSLNVMLFEIFHSDYFSFLTSAKVPRAELVNGDVIYFIILFKRSSLIDLTKLVAQNIISFLFIYICFLKNIFTIFTNMHSYVFVLYLYPFVYLES